MNSKLLDLNTNLAHKLRLCIGSGILTSEEASVIASIVVIRHVSHPPLSVGWAQETMEHLFDEVEVPHEERMTGEHYKKEQPHG